MSGDNPHAQFTRFHVRVSVSMEMEVVAFIYGLYGLFWRGAASQTCDGCFYWGTPCADNINPLRRTLQTPDSTHMLVARASTWMHAGLRV